MTIEELRKMKKFPQGKTAVSASDKALVVISKTEHTVNKKGKKKFIYQGEVHFIYENGIQYRTDFREKTLKLTIKKTMECFDQRNKQMTNYEKRGLDIGKL